MFINVFVPILLIIVLTVFYFFNNIRDEPMNVNLPLQTRYKVAVCLSGEFGRGNYMESYNLIKKNLVDQLNADVYMVADLSDKGVNTAITFFQPVRCVIEDFSHVKTYAGLESVFTSNLYKMLAKMNRVTSLCTKQEAYDIIIVVRPDLNVNENIHPSVLEEVTLKKDCIFCARKKGQALETFKMYGFTDMIFMGSPQSILKMCPHPSAFDHIQMVNVCRMNEYILQTYARKNGICVLPFDLQFCIQAECKWSLLEWFVNTYKRKKSLISMPKMHCDYLVR